MVTAIIAAFVIPPVNIVINIDMPTPIIAPKYGIKLNSPIIKPNKTAYFTFNIDNPIATSIPTIIASII